MKTSIGRIVHFTFNPDLIGSFDADAGQTQTVPAIIVRVWSDEVVNLRVFPDSSRPSYVETSVPRKHAATDVRFGYYWEWPTMEAD